METKLKINKFGSLSVGLQEKEATFVAKVLRGVNREAAKEKLTGMMDLIGYPEQVLNSTWLNHRYIDLIGYSKQVLNSTWLNHRSGILN